jgi:hypothetical protein
MVYNVLLCNHTLLSFDGGVDLSRSLGKDLGVQGAAKKTT